MAEASNEGAHGVEEFDTLEVLLVIGHDDAVVHLGNGSNDGVESAAGAASSLSIGHQLRPGEAGLLVERQHAARK